MEPADSVTQPTTLAHLERTTLASTEPTNPIPPTVTIDATSVGEAIPYATLEKITLTFNDNFIFPKTKELIILIKQ